MGIRDTQKIFQRIKNSASLIMREIQNKAKIRYDLTTVKLSLIKQSKITSVSRDEQIEALSIHLLLGNVNYLNFFSKQYGHFS